MLRRAHMLAAARFDVLLFDFHAHGESAGLYQGLGAYERDDAVSAVALARQRRPGLPVAVIGWSLGGVAALLAGPRLGADVVIAEAVPASLETAVFNRIRLRLGRFAATVLTPALLVQAQPRFGIDPEALRPLDTVTDLGAPLLLMAGGIDRRTTLEESRALFDTARQPKALWVLPEAGHEDFLARNPDGYATHVLDFLTTHIKCPTAGDGQRTNSTEHPPAASTVETTSPATVLSPAGTISRPARSRRATRHRSFASAFGRSRNRKWMPEPASRSAIRWPHARDWSNRLDSSTTSTPPPPTSAKSAAIVTARSPADEPS